MANPFASGNLNTEILQQKVNERPEGLQASRKQKPARDSSQRLKKN